MKPNLDFATAIQTAFFLAAVGAVITLILGFRSIRRGRKL